ncbi:glutamate-5-semialdehyde dehydrogenase [Sedimentibacter acidaminivorans]|uniref:Gamma-glutamyl phosphate reductase n=1 Tax=Sedimentibacter acidaminivorans TaxID=913099 RepID=A0ABS4GHQ8_9FIRM|nr:glutamate-5-semialdehyde dehydrogenase [Sedimentibacter acidaminivorans]MBP1927233.1 glutamate-5-semialdehyde dehydrogenase [Sedimentibacter acidaminivorans]
MNELIVKGENAKAASYQLMNISTEIKNNALKRISDNLVSHSAEIIEKNQIDITNSRNNGMNESMIDRLMLNEDRIKSIAEGVNKIADLDDPVGEVLHMIKRPNGLVIGQKRVPLGVIGIIYESRPNVTVDAAALCLKSSNSVMLRGSKDAINSNKEIVKILKLSLKELGINEGAIELIEDTSRETAAGFMKLNDYLNVLIPRGGAGLIKTAVENATVPVIQTGTGNCHIYVDEYANFDMAYDILINAKTSRVSVCNSCESLLVHRNIKDEFLPDAIKKLREKNVEVRGCEETIKICKDVILATEGDYGKEFLDYIISVKVVDDLDTAVKHINKYGTGHSESIITESYTNSQKFLNEVDAAAVYVNASTRFTDGFEFGFGAEIGISTQKIHARGPMGLKELTTTKYIIYGNGQIR